MCIAFLPIASAVLLLLLVHKLTGGNGRRGQIVGHTGLVVLGDLLDEEGLTRIAQLHVDLHRFAIYLDVHLSHPHNMTHVI